MSVLRHGNLRPAPRPRPGEAGLTLVELMVTLVISSIVAISTFMFFAGQKSIYETQTKLLNVQQNLWAAMETLSRNVRAAGAGMVGCVRPDADDVGPDTGDPPPVGNTPPQTGLRVWLAPGRPNYPAGAARLAPLWIRNGPGGAPDSITVVYGMGASGNFTDADLGSAVGSAAAPILTGAGVPSPASAFLPGEFMLLVHNRNTPPSGNLDRGCTLFQVTGVNLGTHTLEHAGSSPWNTGGTNTGPFTWGNPAAPGTYTPAQSGIRNFGQLRWVRFAIDDPGGGAPPNLTMQRLDLLDGTGTVSAPQILAEGVEDMQIAYACDLTGPAGEPDGLLTEGTPSRATDEWIFNDPADIPPATCTRPQAVRITLIARSLTTDDTLSDLQAAGTNFKPAAEDGIPGVADRFRHRILRTTITPRN